MGDLESLTPLGQFRTRHLFWLMAGCSVLFAVVAALVRDLPREKQISALVQVVIMVAAIVASTGLVLRQRQKLERQAGKRIERFTRLSGRLVFWGLFILMSLFAILYPMQVGFQIAMAQPGAYTLMPPSPVILFFAVNFFVVRVWWKIDFFGIEACEHGLVLGGWGFIPWTGIKRYTWSGKDRSQLNLFATSMVSNLRVDASCVSRMDEILAQHVGQSAEAVPAAV